MRALSRLLSLLLLPVIAGMLPIALPRPTMTLAQSGPQVTGAADQPPTFDCYGGANPPLGALCLVVPVEYADGSPADDAEVTAFVAEREQTQPAVQLPGGPADEVAAAIDVGQLGARPGDTIAIEVTTARERSSRYVGLTPGPTDRTHRMAPVALGQPPEHNGQIWGTVSLLDDRAPLAGATVTLYAGSTALGTTTTRPAGSASDEPIFRFETLGGLPLGSPLRLEATYGDQQQSVLVTWEGQPIEVPIVLGWTCVFAGPRNGGGGGLPRNGGGGGLPPDFCLTGRVLANGEEVADVQVSLEVPGKESLLTVTSAITGLLRPMFAANIGDLVAEAVASPEAEQMRIIAVQGDLVGTLTLSIDDLPIGERWGQMVTIPLRSERMGGLGLAGGTPRPIALGRAGGELHTYVGLPEGGGVVAQIGADSLWLRMLGTIEGPLPTPDVSALHVFGTGPAGDQVLAGTRSGELLASNDGARHWAPLSLPTALGPIAAITALGDGTLLVGGRDGLVRLGPLPDGGWDAGTTLTAPPFAPRALAALADGTLIAGAASGLYTSADGAASWQQQASAPVSALAVVAGNTQTLLIGTPDGLMRAAAPGALWEKTPLTDPVLGLAVSGTTIRATTPGGVVEAETGALTWRAITGSDTSITARHTVGAPDLLDLAVMPDEARSLAAATSTGIYRSGDGGLTWNPLPGWPANVVPRSVAPLGPTRLIAVAADHAYLWDGSAWEEVGGLPAPLNGAVVRTRVEADRTLVLVGRANTRGATLYASSDSAATWSAITVGAGRGITAIDFYQGAREGYAAIIGSDGDGIFGWSPDSVGAVGQLPALSDPASGRAARVSAVRVLESGGGCAVVVGTTGSAAGVASRVCSGAWSAIQPIVAPGGANVGAITAIVEGRGDQLLAATSEGLFQGTLAGGWTRIFGLPLRPLTLVAPPSFANDRLLVAGGPQSGAVLLSDVTADLRVDVGCTGTIQGERVGTCVVEVTNQGLLPTEPGTLAVNLASASPPAVVQFAQGTRELTFTVGALRASAVVTFPLSVQVGRDARPGIAVISATMPDSSERFPANNRDEALVYLAYRSGADPAVIVSGQTMARPGQDRDLRVRVPNLGDQGLDRGMLRLTLPPSMTLLSVTPRPTRVEGDTQLWDLPRLPSGASFEIGLRYRMPPAGTPADALTVVGDLADLSDDRELNNNRSSVTLMAPPTQPQGIVLTNWSRLARLGPIDRARTAVEEYLAAAGGFEIALDDELPCQSGGGALSCAYQAWDDAVARLAAEAQGQNRPARMEELAAGALDRRAALVERIARRVTEQLPPDMAAPAFLYIIGGDAIIPAYAYEDRPVLGQSIYPERLHAATLDPADPFYSVLIGAHYPSYAFYDQMGGRSYDVGVQPGTPEQIAGAVEMHNKLGGQLALERASIAGYAKDLTADIQQRACADLQGMSLPLAGTCDTITPLVSSGSSALQAGAGLQLLSDHSDQWNIGDLSSLELAGLAPPGLSVNLLLLLGCHTGLSPLPGPRADPSLVDVLGGQGQPAFGYTGYAYAGADDPQLSLSHFEPIYAERLHQLLTRRLLTSSGQLGALRRQAIADFGVSTGGEPALRRKTLETLTLYGPPTYRLGGVIAGAVDPLDAPVGAAQTTAESIALTYAQTGTASGTLFSLASSTAGGSVQQSAVGRTTQPGLDLSLPAGISGALIRGSAYRDLAGVDPVIRRVAPMGDFGIYSEPRYTGPARDWATPLATYVDGDQRRHLVAALGQWAPAGQTQRLFERLDLELVRPADPAARPPEPPQGLRQTRTGQSITVKMTDGKRLQRVELVLYEDGAAQVYPLTRSGRTWAVTLPAQSGSQFLIQALGTDGSVIFDTNLDQLYAANGAPVPAPQFAACPAGWAQLGRYQDVLTRSTQPTLQYHFELRASAKVALLGFAQEGHPEAGCPGSQDCNQGQDHESFSAAVDGATLGTYRDQGADLNTWLDIGRWEAEQPFAAGWHTLSVSHLQEGAGPQSVGYRLTLCGQPAPGAPPGP